MRRLLCLVIAALAFSAQGHAASVDGVRIHSESTGRGPTIIFVHGWTCDTTSWSAQVPAFSDDHRVILLDLPGHGKSDAPAAGSFSMELFARAVEAVRAEAGADKIVLVGHSMGAPVIRKYALLYPQHVAGIVAVDGSLDVRGFAGRGAAPSMTREARENMVRGMFVPTTPAAVQQKILATMLGTPEVTANGAMAAMFSQTAGPNEVIRAPALAVVAGTGRVPDTAAMKAIVPDFASTQVAGTGHFLMLEKPAEFNRLLQEFLDRIRF